MKNSYLALLLLALCFAPVAAKASSISEPNSLTMTAPVDGDGDLVSPGPEVDENKIVGVKVTNVGFRKAALTKLIAEYEGDATEVHDLGDIVLNHADNVILPLSLELNILRTTVFFFGRTRIAFEYLTAKQMPQPAPQPEPAPADGPSPSAN